VNPRRGQENQENHEGKHRSKTTEKSVIEACRSLEGGNEIGKTKLNAISPLKNWLVDAVAPRGHDS
jgi:hypothetical protein